MKSLCTSWVSPTERRFFVQWKSDFWDSEKEEAFSGKEISLTLKRRRSDKNTFIFILRWYTVKIYLRPEKFLQKEREKEGERERERKRV